MSKYRASKCSLDGYDFDSKLEMSYYCILKDMVKNGEIKGFVLQPVYELQPKFTKFNKNYRAINYIADFEVELFNGTKYVVDTKGFQTSDSKLKEKMFNYVYPNLELKMLGYVAKYGGFLPLDEINKIRRENKKKKDIAI
jgi:hypothetical protein